MSLAALLNLGKKDKPDKPPDDDEEAPIPAIEEFVAEEPKEKEPPRGVSAPSLNLEELKLAQELAQTQSKVMEPEFERRRKEEEDAQRADMEKAAAKARELAKQARDNPTLFKDGGMYKASFANSNPFTSGGKEFKPGVFVCDTAFGGPKPVGARSTIDIGAQASDERERSRSPAREPWSAGGCAAFSPAWTGPQQSSESSMGAGAGAYGKGSLDGGYGGKGGYGCGGYDGWGGGGCPGWGAPAAWGGCGGEAWYGGKGGCCGGYDYGPPGGYGRGPPVGYAAPMGYGGRPPVGYGAAPGYGAPGVPGYGVRQW